MVPIVSDQHDFGLLVVASDDPLRRPFGPPELIVVEAFAKAAAVALAFGEARGEVERLAVTAEQHRIAADLHDSVIQQLFGVGLHLLQLKAQSPPPISARVDESVRDIDEIITKIRQTIFGVHNADVEGGIDNRVQQMATDAAKLLGFAPRVTASGTEAIGADISTQLLLVLREALSNVIRHARATRVDVSVSVESEQAVLCVTDDGIGPPTGPTDGWGLESMAQRAANLGGRFSLERALSNGTRLEWSAPLRADSWRTSELSPEP